MINPGRWSHYLALVCVLGLIVVLGNVAIYESGWHESYWGGSVVMLLNYGFFGLCAVLAFRLITRDRDPKE